MRKQARSDPALTNQHINSAQHGALATRVTHSGKRPSAVFAIDAPKHGGVSDHAGDLPAESVRQLAISGEFVGRLYQGTNGTHAARLAATRVALAAIRSDGLEASQSALPVGDDDARVLKHMIDKRMSQCCASLLETAR